MENKDIIYTLLLGLFVALCLESCDKKEIETYHADRSLFFERWKQTSATARERIDTVGYSFSHYVGKTELTHEFQIKLIGVLLEEDTEYRVIVVDSLTTATEDQYSLPEKTMFRKGEASDVLPVTLKKVPSLKDKQVYLTLRLVANENFGLGYTGYSDVKIRFNDQNVIPLWWTQEVTDAYLGKYSFKKLETVIAANEGFSTFEGLSDTEKRKIALNTKAYILANNIKEENGDPMEIPMY